MSRASWSRSAATPSPPASPPLRRRSAPNRETPDEALLVPAHPRLPRRLAGRGARSSVVALAAPDGLRGPAVLYAGVQKLLPAARVLRACAGPSGGRHAFQRAAASEGVRMAEWRQ